MLRCRSRSKRRTITFVSDGSVNYNPELVESSESSSSAPTSPTLLSEEIVILKQNIESSIRYIETMENPLYLFSNRVLFAHLAISIDDIPSHRRGYFDSSSLYGKFIKLATLVLSRDLPPSATYKSRIMDPHIDLCSQYQYFSSLKYIYELLLKLFSAPDLKRSEISYHIDSNFLRLLFSLFDSDDPREVDYVVLILQKLYTQCIDRREMIRLYVICKLRQVANGSRPIVGINGLLELVMNITKASGVNISNTQDNIYISGILPLLKAPYFSYFASSYSSIIYAFVTKSEYFAIATIKKMLKQWPYLSSEIEIYHLDILTLILSCVSIFALDSLLITEIVKRLSNCSSSPHYQVAEIALTLMNSDIGIPLLLDDSQTNLVASINAAKIAKKHWHSEVKSSANQLLNKLYRLDSNAFKAAENLSIALLDNLSNDSETTLSLDSSYSKTDKSIFKFTKLQYKDILYEKFDYPDQHKNLQIYRRRKSVTLKLSKIDEIGSLQTLYAPQE